MTLLVVSLLTLAAGPILFRVADHARTALAGIDGFVMVSVAGLALVHIIPHAASLAGPLAVAIAVVGFVGPGLVEHQLERAAHKAHAATLALAICGLVLHEFLDGVGLAAPGDAHGSSVLAVAVVLHRLPIAITIWSLLAPSSGPRVATGVLIAIGASTVLGYVSGDLVVDLVEARWVGLFEALIAGSLLHVVVHRPPPLATPNGSRRERVMSGVGALLGVAVVAVLADEHIAPHVHDSLGFSEVFITLALESAPALLIAFVLAGVVHVVLPAASLRWMGKGSRAGQALRGVTFGIPLSICSCGVIPLYRTLVIEGVPATAAMAFLVATPELGIDSVLISVPLLGTEFTLVRLAAAAIVALIAGVVVGRIADRAPQRRLPSSPVERKGSMASRVRAGLHFGLVEIVDHTMPWILLGLAIAALVDPLLDADWVAALPWGADVILFAFIGMPMYVCASGATPLVAVLIHKGVSPGAALAFLMTGPATNVTTFGLLSHLHGKKVAIAFGGVIAGLTIALGLLVDAARLGRAGVSLQAAAIEHPGRLQLVCLVGLVVVVALSVIRQGPRAFVGQVLSPYAPEGGGHTHGDGHDHGHDHDAHDHGHA